jgi:hypothetical protein
MKRLSHTFAVLVFALALLMGAAGGAMAQVGSMDLHGSHHAPSGSVPSPDGSHKAAFVVVAPCCPAAEVPAKHIITVVFTTVCVSWNPNPERASGVRDIRPEPHPPKIAL